MTRPAENIREEMQHVRREIAEGMDEVVESTRELTDWRCYVRRYPLACVGLALAAGYIIMPKRLELISPDAATLEKLAKRNKLVVKTDPKAQAKSGLAGTMLGLVGNAVVRAGIAYAGQQLGKATAEQASVD